MVKSLGLATILSLTFLTGCSTGRNTSTPAQSLIGHWRTEKTAIRQEVNRCYFPDGKVTFHNKAQDSRNSEQYVIINESPAARIVRVRWGDSTGSSADIIQFTENGKTASIADEVSGEQYTTMHYIDDDLEPCS